MSEADRFPSFPGKRLRISDESIIRERPPQNGASLPYTIEATVGGVHLLLWARQCHGLLENKLATNGAVLLRGFLLGGVSEFELFVQTLSGELLDYIHGSTPRTRVKGKIFTSTEYPPTETIPLHNEQSYTRNWPGRLFFYCEQAATAGGETPIANSRRVFNRIHPAARERFIRDGVMYVLNYGGRLGIPWQDAFQTTEKSAVEAYCRQQDISFEWTNSGVLRTTQTCQAVVSDLGTGDEVWFNQAHLFHPSSLAPEVFDAISSMCAPTDFPRNAFYGDGSPIEPDVLEDIRRAYHNEEAVFQWNAGDVLILDNVLVAHGRRPYTGSRKVLVGMSRLASIDPSQGA